MGRRDVESLEVVPIGLDLRTVRYREAHSEEHVFQLVTSALYEVEVADQSDPSESGPTRVGKLRQIEAVGFENRLTVLALELCPSFDEQRLETSSDLPETPTGFAPFCRLQRAESTMSLGDLGTLPEQLDLGCAELVETRTSTDSSLCSDQKRSDVDPRSPARRFVAHFFSESSRGSVAVHI